MGIGTDITNGETDLATLADYARENADITILSGRQENLEWTLNKYIFER